jgi:hypothetical protein
MKSTLQKIAGCFILLFFIGCSGMGTASYLVAEKAEPTDPKNIHVYATTKPDAAYTILGYVSVYDAGGNDIGNALRDKLKEHAAEFGADAIISFKLNMSGAGGGAQGIAIKFKK